MIERKRWWWRRNAGSSKYDGDALAATGTLHPLAQLETLVPGGFGAAAGPANSHVQQVRISVLRSLNPALHGSLEFGLAVDLLTLHTLALRQFHVVDIGIPQVHTGVMT